MIEPNDDPNHIATRLSTLLDTFRRGKPQYLNTMIFQDGCPIANEVQQEFFDQLMEDEINDSTTTSTGNVKKACGDESYVDFLCDIHRLIQDKLH